MASRSPAQIPQVSGEIEQFQKFIDTTVHHLREPFRMMNIYGELLGDASHPEAPGFFQKASAQVQTLLDGLAEFASISSTPVDVDAPVRLDLPVRQAVIHLAQKIEQTGASITYGELPTVRGNFDRLQLVFLHLFRNALQFRDANRPVKVAVSARLTGAEWVVEVRDNGSGISPQFHSKIFEPYSRMHDKAVSGHGLGLAVCKAILDRHHSRLWVESTPGQGSTFFFTLPPYDTAVL